MNYYFKVYPITSGSRKVLVFEFWPHEDGTVITKRPIIPPGYDKSSIFEYLTRCAATHSPDSPTVAMATESHAVDIWSFLQDKFKYVIQMAQKGIHVEFGFSHFLNSLYRSFLTKLNISNT